MSTLTRRQLVGAAAAAGGTALAAQLGLSDALAAPGDRAWRALGRDLDGQLVRPGASRYRVLSRPYNRRYAHIRPSGIVRCASERDVRRAVRFAREHELPLAARSGGHSYAGYSTTRGLLIDLGGLRAAAVDDEAATITAAAGARNTDVYAALQPHGAAISAGRCPSVAIAGLALGGGFGFSSRALGLTCDALRQARAVTADGEVVTCSADENADLFWALRGGGGGNFAITTSLRFATTPVSDVALYDLTWDAAHAPRVMAALQRMVLGAPDRLSCRMGMGSDGRGAPTVTALGQLFGPLAELEALLGPVLAVAKPAERLIARRTFWQAKEHFFHSTPVDRFAVKSAFVDEPLTPEALEVIARGVARYPGSSNPDGGGVALYAWGGAIGRVAPDATAFVHRRATWLMAYDASWTARDDRATVARNLGWLERFAEQLAPHVGPSAYQNFMDRSQQDWRRAYYGDNAQRLERIKREVDPDRVFDFRQAI
jgi:FAD/FMN-containing dehydrogenase